MNSGCEARSMRKFILVDRPDILNSAKQDLKYRGSFLPKAVGKPWMSSNSSVT